MDGEPFPTPHLDFAPFAKRLLSSNPFDLAHKPQCQVCDLPLDQN